MIKLIILGLLSVSYVFAGDYDCTEWTETRSSCAFNGKLTPIYERQCEASCMALVPDQDCDKERVCSPVNPAALENICTQWVRAKKISCINSNTNRLEQKWIRVCTIGSLTESWCSDSPPQ